MVGTNLAVCGVGLVGQRHLDAAAQIPDISICGVVEPGKPGRDLAESRGMICYPDLDALFAAQSVDGIIIATPTPLHIEHSLAAINRGCPVLIEKPITGRAAEGDVIVAASKANGTPVLVGHHRRHNPLVQRAHEVIASGAIGEVRAVNGTCWFYKPDHYFDAAPWRKEPGAGPVSVNLVHDIDLIRYLCGDVVTVSAHAAPSLRGFANEDVAAAVLTLANGAIATITVSDSIVAPWSWEMTSREYPIYPPTSENCYLIGGSEGSISVPDLRVWSYSGGVRDWWTPISATSVTREASDPLVNQLVHFREVIHGRAEPLVPASEGLRTLRVVEAIKDAAASGQPVDLGADPASDEEHAA